MPRIIINDADLHYMDTGADPNKETIVFSHGLLWSGYMFYKQEAYFKKRYRIIAYDHRGQGMSQVTESGYDMDSLYEDAAQLIEKLCPNEKVHFAGLSMGGFIGMRLAARRPDLLKSLILMETSAEAEPAENVPKYRMLSKIIKNIGWWPVAWKVMRIMFGKKFLVHPERAFEKREWRRRLKSSNKEGMLKATDGVIDRKPILDELKNIDLPTIVMVGTMDVATVPAKAEKIVEHIKGSKLVFIENGGHTSSIEEPAQVNAAMDEFLSSLQ
jgi:3-oxoadipate enol-lactonase